MLIYPCCSELFNHRSPTGLKATVFARGLRTRTASILRGTWASKMITVHEKMYPRPSTAYCEQDPVLGLRRSKSSNSMGKISTVGVLRLRATKRCVTR